VRLDLGGAALAPVDIHSLLVISLAVVAAAASLNFIPAAASATATAVVSGGSGEGCAAVLVDDLLCGNG